MGLKGEIKALAARMGMDLCGVANIERFETAPPELHPARVLPGCRSVVVIGVRLLDGVVQANFRDFEDGQSDLKGLYGTYGYTMLPNFELTYACYNLAQLIERRSGEVATPCSTGPMTNGRQVSIRHCAVAAGLGEFGWMSIVLTPQFGPRNRFGVVLTTAALEPDPLYGGERLCDPARCGICTRVCPSGALSGCGEGAANNVDIEGRRFTYCKVDQARCLIVQHRMRKEFGGEEDYLPLDAPLDALGPVQTKLQRTDFGLQHAPSWHCGRCLSYCPAGKWGETFAKRGLSRGPGGAMETGAEKPKTGEND